MSPTTDRPDIRRCLLTEDHPESLWRIQGLLELAFPGVRVNTATTLRSALGWAQAQPAGALDLAVVDLGLPDGTGLDILRRLPAIHPRAICVVASIYDDDAHLFEAIAAGAWGYVLKGDEDRTIVACLQRIVDGEPALSPAIARRILEHLRAAPAAVEDEAGLSARETEVLTLLARGMTAAEAAASLGLRRHTVAGYIKVIYQKLNVTTRAGATLAAVRLGLA